MRIVLDLQGAQTESRFRGIGRYSLSLAQAIARNAGEHEVWIALNAAFPETISEIRIAFDGLVPPEHIRVFDIPAPICERNSDNKWRTHAAERVREHFLLQLKPDIVHVSSLFEGYVDDAVVSIGTFTEDYRTAVTLYDLIPFLDQDTYLSTSIEKNYYFRKLQSLKKATLLLAISESSRREAVESLQIPEGNTVCISASIDERFCPILLSDERASQLYRQYGIERKMVMYAPGGFDARKNFDGLFAAYARLSGELRSTHQLVIVSKVSDGDRANLMNQSKSAGLKDGELVLTGFVSDEDLVAFYNLTTLFVFPSKHEGFGLPALEAMACGAPTIGSNTSSIPEVIGWPDAMFDPDSVDAIAEKMTQVLSDSGMQLRLREHGLRQAKRFSWDVSAKCTISAFESLVGANPSIECVNSDVSENDKQLMQSLAAIDIGCEPADRDLQIVANTIAFNTSNRLLQKLLVDISEIVRNDAKSGIQRVVRSILMELMNKEVANHEVCPVYFDGDQYRYANQFKCKLMGIPNDGALDSVVDFNQDDIYLSLDLNAHLTGAVHPLHMYLKSIGVRMYFVVYDILLTQRADWWPVGTSVIFEGWLKNIAQVATGLICISKAVADEVGEWLLKNPSDRTVELALGSFHLGANLEDSAPTMGMPRDSSKLLDALSVKPNFLMVGTLEPRKGYAQALEAFEQLWANGTDVNLVFVGKKGWKIDELVRSIRGHAELNKRLFWLEGISDEYLEKVYAASTCLIAASEGEGFGLPLIEAAQHKLPIIARDLPVFQEVARDHAFYFNGLAPESLADAVSTWLEYYAAGSHPKSDHMPWLTWQQSTEALTRVIFEGNWYSYWKPKQNLIIKSVVLG